MTQTKAVEEVIRRLGGLATLKQIYKHIHEVEDCRWNTKTPDASVRRIVQLDANIVRIAPGIWCLKEFADNFANERVGANIPITQLIQRIMSIPSSEKRYDMYINLRAILSGTSWDRYDQTILTMLKDNENNPVIYNFNAAVGQVIAHADIHHE